MTEISTIPPAPPAPPPADSRERPPAETEAAPVEAPPEPPPVNPDGRISAIV